MKKVVSDSHDVASHPVEVATVTECDQSRLFAKVLVGLIVSEQRDVYPRPLRRDPYDLCKCTSLIPHDHPYIVNTTQIEVPLLNY